jgi:hypothetical protein
MLTQPQQASTAEPELGTAQPQLVLSVSLVKAYSSDFEPRDCNLIPTSYGLIFRVLHSVVEWR